MTGLSGGRILLLQPFAGVERHLLWFEEFGYQLTVRNQPLCCGEENNLSFCGEYDAIICPPWTGFPQRALQRGRRLQIIAALGPNPQEIDIQAASERGILVTDTAPCSVSIAEHTIAMMLALAKRLQTPGTAETPQWELPFGFELCHRTLGLLGVGAVGEEILRRMKGWGLRCIAWEPGLSHERATELGVLSVGREALFRQSDILTVQPEHWGQGVLVGARELEWIRPSALLIGAACGPSVDRMALTGALQQNKIRGAALDRWGGDAGLQEMAQVILLPAQLPLTAEAAQQAADQATIHVIQALRGEVPSRLLNPEALLLWKRSFHTKSHGKEEKNG